MNMPTMPAGMNMPSGGSMDMGMTGMRSWIFASPEGEFYYLSNGWFVDR